MQFDRKKASKKPTEKAEDSKPAGRRTRDRKVNKKEDEEVGIKSTRRTAQTNKDSKPEQNENQEQQGSDEEEVIVINKTQEKTEKVTWDETKDFDDNEIEKQKQKEKELEESKKQEEEPTKKSWVPQQQKEQQSEGFKIQEEYMPSLGDPDAEKNAPKEAPKKMVRAEESSSGRPRFFNSNAQNKDLMQPLQFDKSQLTPMQIKEMELENSQVRSYNSGEPHVASNINFGGSRPKFTNSANSAVNNNSAPLQLTIQQQKEMEAEAKLMSGKVYKTERPAEGETTESDKQLEFKSQPFKMTGAAKPANNNLPLEENIQQKKEREAEERLQKLKEQNQAIKKDETPSIIGSSEGYKPKFGTSKPVANNNFKPLEKTEQQKKLEEMENKLANGGMNQQQEQVKTETSERPRFGFTNTKKAEGNFKPLEKTEQQKKLEEVENKLQQQKSEEEQKREKSRKNKNFGDKKTNNNTVEEDQKTKQIVEDGWNKV